ncbi:3-oxoacid CoA-transferase subunit A [Neobacillus bataviensis LMG 21833]|uniref:3-oxoacid CoA-transferase subunit A n=1 Tax=Neobacillus bataviensis LMG 21833 TaxID=1117379 RepID=K6DQR1_9BACI|nr:CoA transferase subunit A [Neobacillus bataviensis]EKN70533.1 3-oxoacid CoA-transferase subunit A [Neobacillus bataviensis LMG 21833]
MTNTLNCEKLKSAEDAVKWIQNGDQVLVGGFGLCGSPFTLIDTIAETDHARDLTIISNNLGEAGKGLGKLLISEHIKKAIGSYFTSNRDAVKAWKSGELEIELIPQGTLAEAIRAGGAGIAGFYTKTAVGTKLAEGKEERVFDGERYLFVRGIKANVALIKAWKADTMGNLIYSQTARNFNPMMATAADLVIAEVDEIVEVGTFAAEQIATPHSYVDIIVLNDRYTKIGGEYVESSR